MHVHVPSNQFTLTNGLALRAVSVMNANSGHHDYSIYYQFMPLCSLDKYIEHSCHFNIILHRYKKYNIYHFSEREIIVNKNLLGPSTSPITINITKNMYINPYDNL